MTRRRRIAKMERTDRINFVTDEAVNRKANEIVARMLADPADHVLWQMLIREARILSFGNMGMIPHLNFTAAIDGPHINTGCPKSHS